MEKQETYLWNHHPELSAAPFELIERFVKEDDLEVFECGIFLLENDKIALVRFSSEDKTDNTVGVTEVQEFDSITDAAKLFGDLTKELE